MNPGDGMILYIVATFVLAAGALVDLHRVEAGSITVYTTPALRDLVEKGFSPKWSERGGLRIEPVYVAAGEQYNRLRMSGAEPEADLFLHASPLFLIKGYDEGYMEPIKPKLAQPINSSHMSATKTDQGAAWYAFAWSPLVEVYPATITAAPDLASADLRFGLPHPTLSNNGIYSALFLEKMSPAAGQHAKRQTVVQPVNARTNINGVADGSFDVTLGYEAVALFYQKQGAKVSFGAPLVEGRQASTPVLFSAALVDGPHREQARQFVDFLFENETQAMLGTYSFRSVYAGNAFNSTLPPGIEMIDVDWDDWRAIERILPSYEVIPTYG